MKNFWFISPTQLLILSSHTKQALLYFTAISTTTAKMVQINTENQLMIINW